ncbi:MAG: hypothetical protein QM696_14680 [Steroidobacteraceae bacterium]
MRNRLCAKTGAMAAVAVLLLLALLAAGGPSFWRGYLAAMTAGSPWLPASRIASVKVAGGDVFAPPRADAGMENIAPEAIDALRALAQQQGALLVLVHRHGHLVAEYYGAGQSAATPVAGGTLSPLPWALAWARLADSGQLDAAFLKRVLAALYPEAARQETWRNPWSRAAGFHFSGRPDAAEAALPEKLRSVELLSDQVWRGIGAADAAVQVDAAGRPRVTCCFVAAAGDWMRLADLLLLQGQYAGERVVSPQWVRELLMAGNASTPHLPWLPAPAANTGDEPPATRDALGIDLQAGARLWLSPQRGIAMLYMARPGSALAADTQLPNLVFRGIVDQQPPAPDGIHAGMVAE